MAVLLNIFPKTSAWLKVFHFAITKLMAFPTAKRKDGNTRSVGVNPCQCACSSGEYVNLLPDVFTIIIKQIVIPLNTSKARNRCFGAIVMVKYLVLGCELQVRKLKALVKERIVISFMKLSN